MQQFEASSASILIEPASLLGWWRSPAGGRAGCPVSMAAGCRAGASAGGCNWPFGWLQVPSGSHGPSTSNKSSTTPVRNHPRMQLTADSHPAAKVHSTRQAQTCGNCLVTACHGSPASNKSSTTPVGQANRTSCLKNPRLSCSCCF